MTHENHPNLDVLMAHQVETKVDGRSAVATLTVPVNDTRGEFPFPPCIAWGSPADWVSPTGHDGCAECRQRLVPTGLAGILDQLLSVVVRYVRFPSDEATVLWIAHSWTLEVFDTSPRLAVLSAEKESGSAATHRSPGNRDGSL